MSNLSVALTSARTYLNDDGATLWTDAALIPKAQEAHRELQIKLWKCSSPAVRAQSAAITVTAGATDLSTNQPADLLQPYKLQEYGTSQALSDAVDMTERTYFPNIPQTSALIYWNWVQEKIKFLGSTADRKVVIYYRKLIVVPAASGDAIGILFGELYIGARTAAIAHGSVGNKAAMAILADVCTENFQLVLDAQRGQQTSMSKP